MSTTRRRCFVTIRPVTAKQEISSTPQHLKTIFEQNSDRVAGSDWPLIPGRVYQRTCAPEFKMLEQNACSNRKDRVRGIRMEMR